MYFASQVAKEYLYTTLKQLTHLESRCTSQPWPSESAGSPDSSNYFEFPQKDWLGTMYVLSLGKVRVRLISGSEELLLLLLDLLLCHLLVCVIENFILLRLIVYRIHIHIQNLKSRNTSITSH